MAGFRCWNDERENGIGRKERNEDADAMKSERERNKHSGIRICSEMRKRERKERKGDRMDDKDMKQEG
jgi:hypothetical protein